MDPRVREPLTDREKCHKALGRKMKDTNTKFRPDTDENPTQLQS